MAGKIIADTLEHSTAGSIATNYVVNGVEKCWVNFNGTGTVAIRDSLSVSGLVDGGAGNYTVNYSSAAANTNYTARHGSNQYHSLVTNGSKATSSSAVYAANPSHTLVDTLEIDYGFLGDLA